MIGSTIIAEKTPSRLAEITSVDDLDNFTCLNLDTMITLDFQQIVASAGVQWAEGEPLQDDPDSGMAIFKVNEKGLAYVLAHTSELDAVHQADVRKLAKFVKTHGSSNIYELATF